MKAMRESTDPLPCRNTWRLVGHSVFIIGGPGESPRMRPAIIWSTRAVYSRSILSVSQLQLCSNIAKCYRMADIFLAVPLLPPTKRSIQKFQGRDLIRVPHDPIGALSEQFLKGQKRISKAQSGKAKRHRHTPLPNRPTNETSTSADLVTGHLHTLPVEAEHSAGGQIG